jgi:hypothetical protein
MRNQRKKCTAINGLVFAALLMFGSLAWAGQVAGTVVHLSGPLLAKKADGTVKVLGVKSEVESGDTLVSEKNTYAQIRFIDNSEITLRPGTTFRIENFAFDAGKPEGDNAAFSLVKGGLRSISGMLGKRNKEKFELKAPGATIGIRGTTFTVQHIEPGPPPSQGKPGPIPAGSRLAPGLYVQVIDGLIHVSNPAGTQDFSAGQFGYTSSPGTPPVVVPANPGISFTPPPAFAAPAANGVQSQSAAAQDQAAVDCVVR